jgi:diguanylate cyclase (GGDEF)-like protein/PAS domain S-box-containing protein
MKLASVGTWRYSLLIRVAGVLFASFVVASIGSLLITIQATQEREHRATLTRLDQLLDAVEGTVSAACFVKDHKLADEVAQGLLKNQDILAVTISSDALTLAHRARHNARLAPSEAFSRQVRSPFAPGMLLGEIKVHPNRAVIDQEIHNEVRFVALQLGVLLAFTALLVIATMLFAVVRPIQAMSDRLHSMNAADGDRLAVKKWLKHTEIGRLAEDVNQLAGRLVATLQEEHGMRLRQETEEKKYHSIFENAESGIFIIDRAGRLSSWNPAFQRILELTDKQSPPGTLSLADLPWETQSQIDVLLGACLNKNKPCTRDLALCRPNGSHFWINIVLSPIDADTLQGVAHDVTDLKEAEAHAKRLAITDPLTGLANRSGLEQRMAELVKAHELGETEGFTLMLADLDNFKQVNDGLGLPVGDAILKFATTRLSNCVKSNDTVARISADLFGVLLPNVTLGSDADHIAERIMQELRQLYFVDGSPIKIHACLGITRFPSDGEDPPSLLRNAELALDRAKTHGGNAYIFFDPTLAQAAEQRRHMEKRSASGASS